VNETLEHVAPVRKAALSTLGLTKHYGAVQALSDVSLDIHTGSVLALLGENGAGKSTFISLVSGAQPPTAGRIEFDGQMVDLGGPLDASRRGVAVVHQDPQLANELSIADNLFLARLAESPAYRRISRRKGESEARTLLAGLGLNEFLPDVGTAAGRLSAAERQLVAIAKAMATQASVLFLDEPNSSLTPRETRLLWRIVRQLRDQDVAVVVVSHRLKELYEVVDEVAVLRDGHLVGGGHAKDITSEEAVRMMAGRPARERPLRSAAPAAAGAEVLRLEAVCTESVMDVSLTVRAGEVVGLAGLVGSGRSEIGRAMCGADPVTSGRILLRNKAVRFRSPQAAMRAGVAMTSEERRLAVFRSHSVRFNAVASVLGKISRFGFVDPARERSTAATVIDRLAVRGTQLSAMTVMSGGNQQKVLIGRVLAANPAVLILDEPTHGIDVGTKREIGHLVRELAQEGIGVVFISSEVEELLDVADRILVVRHGRIVHETTAQDALSVVAAALGETADPADPTSQEPS